VSLVNFPEWSSIGYLYSFKAVAEGIEKRLKIPTQTVQIPADKLAKAFYFLDEVAQAISYDKIAVVVRRKPVGYPLFCISALTEFLNVYEQMRSGDESKEFDICSIEAGAEKVNILRSALDHICLNGSVPGDVKRNFSEARLFFASAASRAKQEEESEAYQRH